MLREAPFLGFDWESFVNLLKMCLHIHKIFKLINFDIFALKQDIGILGYPKFSFSVDIYIYSQICVCPSDNKSKTHVCVCDTSLIVDKSRTRNTRLLLLTTSKSQYIIYICVLYFLAGTTSILSDI